MARNASPLVCRGTWATRVVRPFIRNVARRVPKKVLLTLQVWVRLVVVRLIQWNRVSGPTTW